MSKASVRVTSDSSNFQREMKKAVQSMKELSSQTSLATTQAKLFGSAQDQLRAKVSGLEAKISQQTKVVELNKSRQEELTKQLGKWKDKQSELQKKIQSAKTAIEQSSKATGENSDETKALKAELEKLIKEEKDAGAQVEKTEDRLSKQTVATNKSEQALVEMRAELEKTNRELEAPALDDFTESAAAAEKQLEETNQELRTSAWDEYSENADKATAALENAGKKLMVVTGAVVAMGTAAIKTTADFDVGMSNVKAISRATGEEFDALREKALEMGAKTAFSASEAAAAMEYMAQAGWTTEDMLAGIEGVMNAAAASGEDLATTSSILTEGLTSFGMAASESARFADVLVAAGNASNTSVADMGETFKYAGAVCGALGITIEDAAVATGLMANAGIKASNAGTALRSGLSNLVKPTEAMENAMKKYGIAIQTTDDGSVDFMATMRVVRRALGNLDSTTQAAALSTIFGKEAMSGWAAVVTASDEDFRNLTDTINNCTGAAEEASEIRMDNLTGQIEAVKGAIETIAIQIGDILMPTIRNVVAKIQEWADAFVAADEDTKKTIITIAGVVAAIGPLLLGGAKLIQVAKSIAGAFRNLKGIMSAIKVAMGGPTLAIAAVVAAVVALVAAFKHLWETNEAFRVSIIDIWTEIKNTLGRFIESVKERLAGMGITFESVGTAIKTVWEGFCEFLVPVFKNAFQQISDFLTAATNIILDIIDFFAAVFRGDWEAACNEVESIFKTTWQHIVDTFKNAKNTLTGVGDVISGWFEGTKYEAAWTKTWTNICNFFKGIWAGVVTFIDGIKAPFKKIWDEIKDTIVTFIEGIKERLTGLGINFESVSNAIVTVWNVLCEFLVPVFVNAFQEVSTFLKTTANAILAIFDFWTAVFRRDWQGVWDVAKNVFSLTWQHIVATFKNAGNTLKGIANVILGWFGTDWNSMWTSVRDFFVGIWEGITTFFVNIWNGIVTTVTNVFTTIKNVVQTGIMFVVELVKAAFNLITLPWQFIWQNFGDTITSAWNTIKTAVSTGINFVKDIIATVLNKIKEIVSAAWNGIKSVILPVIDVVQSKVSNAWNTIQTVTGTVWNGIKSTTSTVWTGIKSTVTNVADGVKSAVSTAFETVKTKVSSIWDAIKTVTSNAWNSIKSAITTPITNAKNTVSDMIETIKKKFNFSWKLPKLKLPHFSIKGDFSINPPSVPKFSIDWYKTGAIMDAATIFGMNGNTFLGGGEAGEEAILPLEPFYIRLGNMLDTKLAQLTDAVQNVVVYVTCLMDGEEITTRQIVKVEKYLAGSSRAIRRATT